MGLLKYSQTLPNPSPTPPQPTPSPTVPPHPSPTTHPPFPTPKPNYKNPVWKKPLTYSRRDWKRINSVVVSGTDGKGFLRLHLGCRWLQQWGFWWWGGVAMGAPAAPTLFDNLSWALGHWELKHHKWQLVSGWHVSWQLVTFAVTSQAGH